VGFKAFLFKKIFMGFFVATTCISAAMAIIGMLFEPDTHFGYQGLFSPLIYGALTMLPVLTSYSKRELSVREKFIRNLIQFLLIEFIVLLIVYLSGALTSASLAISVALSVFLIYAAVHLVLWVNDSKTAKVFNEALLKMQKHHGYEE
jgi:hypothetical protein